MSEWKRSRLHADFEGHQNHVNSIMCYEVSEVGRAASLSVSPSTHLVAIMFILCADIYIYTVWLKKLAAELVPHTLHQRYGSAQTNGIR